MGTTIKSGCKAEVTFWAPFLVSLPWAASPSLCKSMPNSLSAQQTTQAHGLKKSGWAQRNPGTGTKRSCLAGFSSQPSACNSATGICQMISPGRHSYFLSLATVISLLVTHHENKVCFQLSSPAEVMDLYRSILIPPGSPLPPAGKTHRLWPGILGWSEAQTCSSLPRTTLNPSESPQRVGYRAARVKVICPESWGTGEMSTNDRQIHGESLGGEHGC